MVAVVQQLLDKTGDWNHASERWILHAQRAGTMAAVKP